MNTNGKTTVAELVRLCLEDDARPTGALGTVEYRLGPTGANGEEVGDVVVPSHNTTPGPITIQAYLREMLARAARAAVHEVSSHALDQGRVEAIQYAAADFTNLTQDHLDYHGSMAEYAGAKALLFGPEYLAGTAVLHAADPLADHLAGITRAHGQRVLRFARGTDTPADVRSVSERVRLDGADIEVELAGEVHALRLPLPRDFQVENALAAIAVAHALGLDWDVVRRGLESCPPVPGATFTNPPFSMLCFIVVTGLNGFG